MAPPSEPSRPRIFCIGLNKTGTTSLHHALTALGFTSLHWGGLPSRRAVERAIREDRPLLDYLPDRDAYSDIQRLSVNFDVLDDQYPGSRFILTTRDVDDWIDSRRRHVLRNRERRARGSYDGAFLEVEPERWRERHLEHHERVERYFAARDDLLTMSIADGDGYEALCPFLGVPIPTTPFPWQRRDLTATSTTRRLMGRVRRAARAVSPPAGRR